MAVTAELDIATISVGSPVVDALVEAGLVQSKAAARRAITEGGASINNVRVSDVEAVFTEDQLLHGAWVILRRGKKAVAAGRVATQE